MKKLLALITLSLLITNLFFIPQTVYSNEIEELSKKINELQAALEASKKATTPLESQLISLRNQLNGVEQQVAQIEKDIATQKQFIQKGYSDLEGQREVFNKTVREYYMKNSLFSPLLVFISSADAASLTHMLAYQLKDANQDKAIITNLAIKISDLEERKTKLEKEEKQLSTLKAKLARDRNEIAQVVAGAKDYQKQLSGQIAELSAKQQEIIRAKGGGFIFSIGSGELADEYLSSIKGFNESAPSGYFAIFSIGAYTHRNGMSQYGARGRAELGQKYQQILQAYYPGTTLETRDMPGEINVENHGTISFEDKYLLGIAEMPDTWHPEALKAQAITARTYAYNQIINNYPCKDGTRTQRGNITTDEYCQAYRDSKSNNPPQAWKDAVQATRGQILMRDGKPSSTQYASTHGGFTNNIGWDTKDGNGGSDFIDKSYEKSGGSPWLYKAWWREHYSNSGNTCGRSNPWLSPEEMADIVNAAIALRDSAGIDTGRITPITTSCWGGNPYSMEELRNLVKDKGGIQTATTVTVSQGNGTTNSVTINGINMSGDEFKRAVALRAPGHIRIPQSGFSFFNIEKK